jgi:DNA-directed RNA polymerase specialized sigma24 family protein
MMPSESISPLPDEYREQLDQFIQDHYHKLRRYAIFQAKDKERGDELLHELIGDLYEGKRTLTFSRSPFTYFQALLKSVRFHRAVNRQQLFENGSRLEKIASGENKAEITRITTPLKDSHWACLPEAYDHLEKCETFKAYHQWKTKQSAYHRWLLTQLEQDKTVDAIYQMRLEHPSIARTRQSVSRQTIRVEVSRLLQKVRAQAHAQAVPSGDLEQ